MHRLAEPPSYAAADQRYRLELAKLRIIAQRRDFSPAGDAEYVAQLGVVQRAYFALCEAEVFYPDEIREGESA